MQVPPKIQDGNFQQVLARKLGRNADKRTKTWVENMVPALQALTLLRVPCCYMSTLLKPVSHREIHTFCDAINETISMVPYLRTIQCDENM